MYSSIFFNTLTISVKWIFEVSNEQNAKRLIQVFHFKLLFDGTPDPGPRVPSPYDSKHTEMKFEMSKLLKTFTFYLFFEVLLRSELAFTIRITSCSVQYLQFVALIRAFAFASGFTSKHNHISHITLSSVYFAVLLYYIVHITNSHIYLRSCGQMWNGNEWMRDEH